MSRQRTLGYALACTSLAAAGFLVGCVADSTSTSTGSSGSAGGYGSSTSSEAQPLVVDVDTGGTLVTTPGNGVGIYVEYQAGGHWRITWTCDTALTSLSCIYAVDASVSAGAISNATGESLDPTSDALSQTTSQRLEVTTTTTTGESGVLFDAPAGDPVVVSVRLNAPVAFFFVQNNQVNGGYKGALTNPLILQPSTP
ncbi:MAG TPA: hypothetical protein VH044_15955 [Polyangiaceae bacterium]|jgi:hypothetical protein|nr:hypothetical protein [Polyangiaceae bacterium]